MSRSFAKADGAAGGKYSGAIAPANENRMQGNINIVRAIDDHL
eukprot:CAMPEP_0176192374 /NCGR_PEP_ID=MMETSP0121_2-20121125/4939_1 /TAXON_ID=160619 /ORGANISM="Kryptoperidinium foliaceum, Strain CCMP 1326" /LENGTH=42 /DNA_ID= /DNA_START= /DNA_END= /DNA_ORIENTATION=